MDYEKAYKKALERAKKNYDVAQDLCNGSQIGVERFKNTLTNIFPELGESEYERIRKRLIDLIYKVYAFTNYITCVEYENIIAWLEKQGEQKQEWSKDDDYNLQCVIAKVTSDIQKGNVGRNNELIDWLKSLKDRVQPQPKQEWSEKDEEMAEDLIKGCVSAEKAHHFLHTPKEVSDWLKSLKDRMKGKED